MAGYSGRRRTAARKDADHRLEQALNGMSVTKTERTLARATFNEALSGRRPVKVTTAHDRAIKAIRDRRADLADSTT